MRCFEITVVRDNVKRSLFGRTKRYEIPVNSSDGGFTISIRHAGDDKVMTVSGWIGKDEVSTTVSVDGSPRLKRITKRLGRG